MLRADEARTDAVAGGTYLARDLGAWAEVEVLPGARFERSLPASWKE